MKQKTPAAFMPSSTSMDVVEKYAAEGASLSKTNLLHTTIEGQGKNHSLYSMVGEDAQLCNRAMATETVQFVKGGATIGRFPVEVVK